MLLKQMEKQFMQVRFELKTEKEQAKLLKEKNDKKFKEYENS